MLYFVSRLPPHLFLLLLVVPLLVVVHSADDEYPDCTIPDPPGAVQEEGVPAEEYDEYYQGDFEGFYGGYESYGYSMRGNDDFVQNWYPDSSITLPTCTDATSNPRGHYTSNLVSCEFRFHSIDTTDNTADYQLSNLCSDDNTIGPAVLEYVNRWKDECVGDFARCYLVPRDENIFKDFACHHGLTFPAGTTHLSVNCQDDKQAKLESLEDHESRRHGDDYYQRQQDQIWQRNQKAQQDQIRELERVVFAIVGILVVSCALCCAFGYQLVFRPYQRSMTTTSRDNNSMEISGLVGGSGATEQENEGMRSAQVM